ncbi:hypothetical protein RchiOBHm_Chr1g0344681 [Rosa chinensis]|uniref:Uncharacterized protein n=1 Tax=Rosa chinensis TaxID=74649 RepID=A0A2P6SEK7_ROSCH|nr:hypothetical protein RchiOBHm_Chr1g0344681 [Rosa chinensis]
MKVSPFSYYVLILSIGFRLFPDLSSQCPPQNHRSIQIFLPSLAASSSKPSIDFVKSISLPSLFLKTIDLSRGFKTQFGRSSATRLKPKANHRSISQEDSKPNSVAPPPHAPNPKHSRIDLSVSSKPNSSWMFFGT